MELIQTYGNSQMALVVLQCLGAIFGILGTLLLATKARSASLGFVAFLVSNVFLIAYFLKTAQWYLLAQQLAFLVSSSIGIWVWIVRPAIDRHYAAVSDAMTGGLM